MEYDIITDKIIIYYLLRSYLLNKVHVIIKSLFFSVKMYENYYTSEYDFLKNDLGK